MKILVIGGATQDIYLYSDFQVKTEKNNAVIVLPEDTKIEIGAVAYATGGGATNTAVSFKRLGLDSSIVCLLGNDPMGRMILNDLEKEKVNTQYIKTLDNKSSGISCILPTKEGKRTILAHRGVNTLLDEKYIPLNAFDSFEYIYVSSLSGQASQALLPIAKKAHELGIPVATNPGGSQLYAGKGAEILYKSLSYVHIFILNAQEAKQFMSTWQPQIIKKMPFKSTVDRTSLDFDLSSYCGTLFALGVKIIVVTDGANGVYVAHNDMLYFHPALKFEVKNTVGAGDSFGSAFVASIAKGLSISQALQNGMINSASVLSHKDAKEGLLTWQELMARK